MASGSAGGVAVAEASALPRPYSRNGTFCSTPPHTPCNDKIALRAHQASCRSTLVCISTCQCIVVAHTDTARQGVADKPALRDDTSPIVLSALHHHTPHASTKHQHELFELTAELLWYVSQYVNWSWWRILTGRGRASQASRLRATPPRPYFLS